MEPALDTEANLPRTSPPVQAVSTIQQAGFINNTNNKQLYQQIPDLLQPSIVALSLTYGFYQIAAFFGVTYHYQAAGQFTSFVAFAGLISSIIFYSKGLVANDSCAFVMNLLFLASLIFVIVLYVVYWLVTPTWPPAVTPNLKTCTDSLKCSDHLHLVAQSAYMGCVLVSFICSLIF